MVFNKLIALRNEQNRIVDDNPKMVAPIRDGH